MNGEVSKEAVTLVVRTGKMTARVLLRAISRAAHDYRMQRKQIKTAKKVAETKEKAREKQILKENKPGEVKLRDLVKKGEDLASAEIRPDQDLKMIERMLRKNGVQYAVQVNDTTTPPTYYIHFKARNADVVNNTFESILAKTLEGKEGPELQKGKSKEKSRQAREPIKQKLNRYKQKVKQAGAKKTKTRTNTKVR